MPRKKKDERAPIITNPRVVLFGEIVVDEGSKCVFEPWMSRKHNVIGWDAKPTNIKERAYIYVAPELDSDGEPQMYLFIGPHGDPAKDRKLGPYKLTGEDA